jgi:lipoate-protein ligase A
MKPLFDQLEFFDDRVPHSAALNMAVDETLLRVVSGPALRAYRWSRPAVSFGYFDKWESVRAVWPDREPVRRWTGGGVVPHGEDWTYSLLIPRRHVWAKTDASESYRLIHEAISGVLRARGIHASAYEKTAEKTSRDCFQNPVRHDIELCGKKIAGAAQRRTRFGLLHQGSVCGVMLPKTFGTSLATALATHVKAWTSDLSEQASELARSKYAAREWLEKF